MSDNNGSKLGELGVFFTSDGIGLGWGVHHEDRRWENEVKLSVRTEWKGLGDFIIPHAWSAWKNKEIAHETWYNWGLVSLFVDIPDLKIRCPLLRQ